MLYDQTLSRVETYFDKTASKTWEQLTSDAPVSKIRQTVRIGRERMMNKLLGQLPNDLSEARILDAGCGTGQLTTELVKRGASVVATDISNSLIQIAKNRIPKDYHRKINFDHWYVFAINFLRGNCTYFYQKRYMAPDQLCK